jgi:hypothetical protein
MSNKFFTANLMGGLGNQMFQIAHAVVQSKRFKVDVKFKPTSQTYLQGHTANKYINNIYRNIKFESFDNVDLVVPSGWGYREINPDPKYSTEFNGYFQSSKNFYGYNEIIKKLFSPTQEFIDKIKIKYPNIENTKNVIVHIRRGDYLKFPEIHPIIDVSYINYCLQKIEKYDTIYVVSDDKEWVRENIKMDRLIVVDGLDDYEELWLISLFNKIIMSNSTFSWWGAFLNQLDSPEIYIPNHWFGPKGEQNINDLYEESWIKINVKYENGKLICC